MNYQKGFALPLVIIFVVIVLGASAGGYTVYKKSEQEKVRYAESIRDLQGSELKTQTEPVGTIISQPTTTVKSQKPVAAPTSVTNVVKKIYRDKENGFELSYDGDIFRKESREGSLTTSVFTGDITFTDLVRCAAFEMGTYYNDDGSLVEDCTGNPSISFFIIPAPFNAFKAYIQEDGPVGLRIKPIRIAGREGFSYQEEWLGDELKVYESCIPASPVKTLCFEYNMLDDSILISSGPAKNYITLVEQQKLIEDIIDSVKFTN